ncbi:MAG TPA: M56 family metallopeptidase, partial [Puia sp.]|nr:M56 family metallopeptidase [Puia sp.]
DNTQLIRFIPLIENFTAASSVPPIVKHDVTENYSITGWQIFYAILIIGSIIMLVRLIMQLISLQKIKKSATIIHDEEAVIYNVDKNITPFSFGNAIYINQDLHSEKELQEIILHEYVHVKQNHTADIILSELICVINWFNPFAWLMRHAIRQNLEFIADNKVLQHGTDKKSYQYHLIKVVGSPQYRIANNFNFSSLKKRIAMMNKIKSAKLHLLRFLFVLPLLAVLLLAFRNKYADIFKKKFSVCNIQGVVIDAQTDKPLADVKIKETISGSETTTNKDGFYSLQINTGKDSLNLKFDLKKNGYEDWSYGYNYAGNYPGFINVLGMFDTAIEHLHKAFMFMPGGKTLTMNPTTDDVSKLFKEITATNISENEFLKFINSHPDLTFYSAEEKNEHIVILKDGSVEKYGYAGGATIEDMERKYGSLPQMMKSSEPDKHPYYHEEWRKISERAQKVFKTDNPNVKEIIFPGDSRVIVILKDGSKPKFYDMDNAVPEERPAFEKLYGSLDGIVPPATNFANGAHNDARYKDWKVSGIEFFGFTKIDFDKDNSLTHFIGQG